MMTVGLVVSQTVMTDRRQRCQHPNVAGRVGVARCQHPNVAGRVGVAVHPTVRVAEALWAVLKDGRLVARLLGMHGKRSQMVVRVAMLVALATS